MNSSLELDDKIIKCEDLKEVAKKEGSLKARQEYTQKIPMILEEAVKQHSQGTATHKVFSAALENYNAGTKVEIEGLIFYDPEKANTDNHKFLMNPALNTASNTAALAHFPASLVGLIRFAKLPAISKIFLPVSYSLKFMNKAYKEAKKPNPDYKKIVKYGAAGVGGTLIFLPTTLGRGALYLSIYVPLTTFFNYMLASSSFKAFRGGERIKDQLPDTNEVKMDLEKQIKKYKEMETKYANKTFEILKGKKAIVDEIINVNKYLKHHLNNIRIRDVDVEVDAVTNDLLGAAARADIVTGTAEFSAKQLKNITAPLFAKIYSHEVSHLDGTVNEGRANFRADRLLEDMAVYNPDGGYDQEMENGRLTAVAHVYAIKRREEIVQQLIATYDKEEELKKAVTEQIKKELLSFGMEDKKIEELQKWLFPPTRRKIIFKLQSIVGGSNPEGGYTVDYYKLLKRERII